MKKDIQLQCPQCSNTVYWNDDYKYRPFCSKRCQFIDFGHWAEEKYTISEPTADGYKNNDEDEQ